MIKLLLAATITILVASADGTSRSQLVRESHFQLNISHNNQALDVVMRIEKNQEFQLYAPGLFNGNGKVKVHTWDNQLAKFDPQIQKDQVLFNNLHEGAHWIGLHRPDTKRVSKNPFQALKATFDEGKQRYFISPILGFPLSAIPIQYFVKCSNILVAIDRVDKHLSLLVFGERSDWSVNKHIDSGFRHSDHGIYYGKFTDLENQNNLELQFGLNNDYCPIDLKNLPKAVETLDASRSYSLLDILSLLPEGLKVQHRNSRINEEL